MCPVTQQTVAVQLKKTHIPVFIFGVEHSYGRDADCYSQIQINDGECQPHQYVNAKTMKLSV